jgi:hypothetical protein
MNKANADLEDSRRTGVLSAQQAQAVVERDLAKTRYETLMSPPKP